VSDVARAGSKGGSKSIPRMFATIVEGAAMGSKWFTKGVVAASHGRIQFDFMFEGIRYRPSIRRPTSEANLRRARERLEDIKRQIELGTFSFAEGRSRGRLSAWHDADEARSFDGAMGGILW